MPIFESAGLWITIGIVVLVLLILVLLCWKRVPADKAMVITGLKKRVLVGRGGVQVPFLETSCSISLESVSMTTDITEAQAYDTEAINETIRQAVNETRGQVLLTSSGELPYAWFHAHSGGTTALAREALGWNKPEPAYTQVMDSLDSKDAPAEAIAWEASFAAADFLRACRAAGVPCETARSVTIGEKGPSGRAVTLLVDGVSVPAPELRIALGSTVMRSTLLDEVRVTDGNVFIAGRGYGHGVGMSQWGAYALAQDGMSGQDIAAYYFKGLSVATLW